MSIRSLRSNGHTPSLVAALLHFDTSFMIWVLLGALGAFVAKDLHLSPAQKGLMVAVPPLGGSLFRLILGPVVDRYGARRTGLISMALTMVPLAWAWLGATDFSQVLGVGLLLGIAGASFVVALPLASRWYPPKLQGLALGIAGAGNSGTIITTLAAPRLAQHYGWHAVFGLAMLPVALVWLAFALLAKEPPRPAGSSASIGALTGLLKEADARSLCVFYLITFGGFVGLVGYLPIFFVDRFGLAKVSAASYAALCAASGSLLRPVGGALADRLGGTRVLSAALVTVAGLGVGLATLPPFGETVALMVLTTGALGVGNGSVFQIVPQRFPEKLGAMTGLVGAAGGLGGFLLPFGFGVLVQRTGNYSTGFVVFALVVCAGAATVARRQRAWRRHWQLEVAL